MNMHKSKLNSNVSLRSDKDLRPWCHDAEREEDLKKCYVELQRVIQRTAPMTKGGCFGPSALDRRSDELQELEKFIRDPDKYIRDNYEQPKVLKADYDEKPPIKKDTTKHHHTEAHYYDDEPVWSDEQIEAGIRMAVQKKFESTGHRVTRFVSATLDPKKKSIYGPQRRKDPLASVKYAPKPRLGPAVHDIGAADFQRFLLRVRWI
jgi:hypothetical protein